MAENREPRYAEEVIDLRELIRTLWAKKWTILGATILAGLFAFLVSKFLVADRYQASAYLTITNPVLRAELETSIQANLVEFETSGLPDLAESAELEQLTFEEMRVFDYEQQRGYEFSASMQGETQLRLVVTAEDPVLAAEAANAWGNVVTDRLNELYGTDEESLQTLEMEVSQAKANWAAAQLALENYLPESQLNSLELRLSAARSLLAKYLQEIDSNRLLISDIQTLQGQIESLNTAGPLGIGTALSLITLQQRATIYKEAPLQIQVDPTWNSDLTHSDALVILQQFNDALQGQNQQLSVEVIALEEEISELVLSVENEQYRVDQLTQERDLARQAYTALSSQLEETRITMTQEEQPARIGAQAVVPQQPNSDSDLLLTALVALVIGGLSILIVLLIDWYQREDEGNIL